mmetsp:Transcript_23484/g.48883  ORF Transcript_23484/g.48883 Transcript_23484/m.48883 type:complete len:254 (-) Transcript_23484:10103-10864(-)
MRELTDSPRLFAVLSSTPPFSSNPSETEVIILDAVPLASLSSSSTFETRLSMLDACWDAASGVKSCMSNTFSRVCNMLFLCSKSCFCSSSVLSHALPNLPLSQTQEVLQPTDPAKQTLLSIFSRFKSYAKQIPFPEQSPGHLFSGRLQKPSLHKPYEQSPLEIHVCPVAHALHLDPPQSTSVSPSSCKSLLHWSAGGSQRSTLSSSLLTKPSKQIPQVLGVLPSEHSLRFREAHSGASVQFRELRIEAEDEMT